MAVRLTRIDELLREQHRWLQAEDRCYFLREYTSGAGYTHSDTNNLISNLKKEPDSPPAVLRHKERAIRQVARELTEVFGRGTWRGRLLVPMPPSIRKGELGYDDRLSRVLTRVGDVAGADVRELLVTTRSYEAVSRGGRRLSPPELMHHMAVDESVAEPPPARVAVVDDVITAGAHFRAARRLLERRFPGVAVVGVFVARTVHQEQ